MTRQSVLNEVSSERDVQIALGFTAAHDDQHLPAEWVSMTCRHLGLCVGDGVIVDDPAKYRRQLIRVAALAVAAVESFDRLQGREIIAGAHEPGKGF